METYVLQMMSLSKQRGLISGYFDILKWRKDIASIYRLSLRSHVMSQLNLHSMKQMNGMALTVGSRERATAAATLVAPSLELAANA